MYYHEYLLEDKRKAESLARSLRRAGMDARRRGYTVQVYSENNTEIIQAVKEAWLRIGCIYPHILVDWGYE